jgi:hypothetical protein
MPFLPVSMALAAAKRPASANHTGMAERRVREAALMARSLLYRVQSDAPAHTRTFPREPEVVEKKNKLMKRS